MPKEGTHKPVEVIGNRLSLEELSLRNRKIVKPSLLLNRNDNENLIKPTERETDQVNESCESSSESSIDESLPVNNIRENMEEGQGQGQENGVGLFENENEDNFLGKSELLFLTNSLPEFNPESNLSIFITEVDSLYNYISGRARPDAEYSVNFSIRNKIKGEAREFVAHQGAVDWPDIKNALLQRYGDSRSEELLVAAVGNCVQTQGETYLAFYSRLLKAYNSLMESVILKNDDGFLKYKKVEYSELAKRAFQNGVKEPYRSFLSHFELATLEECVNKCRALDNKHQQWEYSEFLRKTQDLNLGQKANSNNQQKGPPHPTNPKPFFQRNPQGGYNQRPFTPNYSQRFTNFSPRQGQGQPFRFEKPQQFNNFPQTRPTFGKPGNQPQNSQPFKGNFIPRPQQSQQSQSYYGRPWQVKQEPREVYNAELEGEEQNPQEDPQYFEHPQYPQYYEEEYYEESQQVGTVPQEGGNFREPASEPTVT